MELCYKMKKIKFLFAFLLFVFLFSGVIAEEIQQAKITLIEIQKDMQQIIDENARTVTYVFVSEKSTISFPNKNFFWSVKPQSENNKAYIKTDDKGNLIEADLTASEGTSWTFGEETLKVPKDVRVVYRDGKIDIFGKENQEVGLTDRSSGTELKSNLKLGEKPVSIEKGVISGENFEFGGVKVREGGISLAKGGFILKISGKDSLAKWKGLIFKSNEDLFLATSSDETKNYINWIFPEDSKLSGKGGFFVGFEENNKWAKIEPKDNFGIIGTEYNFEFNLENRDSSEKIPLMNTKGNFVMIQNSMSLVNKGGKVSIEKKIGVSLSIDKELMDARALSTSPVELILDGQDKKYLVSNFKGLACVSLDATEAQTEDRYANSVYLKRASVENRYNYPTLRDLNDKISGKIFNFVGLPEDPEIIRTIIDVYETNPEAFKNLKGLNILSDKEYQAIKKNDGTAAFWDPKTNEITINLDKSPDISSRSFEVLSHELGHNQHLTKPEENSGKISAQILLSEITIESLKEKQKSSSKGKSKKQKALVEDEADKIRALEGTISDLKETRIKTDEGLKSFENSWKKISGVDYGKAELSEFSSKTRTFLWKDLSLDKVSAKFGDEELKKIISGSRWEDKKDFLKSSVPQDGLVRPYGAKNIEEDVATFIEAVRSDPVLFKAYKVLDESSPFYDARYKQKIDLLWKQKIITDKEYDAIFNPEKYFSKEELDELLKKGFIGNW